MDKYTRTAKEYIKTGCLTETSRRLKIPRTTVQSRIISIVHKENLVPSDMKDEVLIAYESPKRTEIDNKEAKRTADLYSELLSIRKTADELGITESKVRRHIDHAKRIGSFDPSIKKVNKLTTKINKLESEIQEKDETLQEKDKLIKKQLEDPEFLLNRDRQTQKLQNEIKSLKSQLLVSEKEVARLQDYNDIMTKLDNRKRNLSKIHPKKGKSESTAVMVASDWHIEEPVDPEGLDGYNEYSLDIARKRAHNFFKNGLYLIKKEKQTAKIDNVVLALIGDFISNYIHPELEEEAQLSPTMAIEMAEDLICDGIEFLLNDGCFENLIIPCCIGNHGRTTVKTRFSTGWQNSYEMLMYRHLQKLYDNNDRVTIKTNKGYHNNLEIYDYLIRFHHGDAIKYQGGIGGITIPVNRQIGRWNVKEQATLDVFGHFHQLHFQSRFVSNGSLIGYNQFAQRMGCEPEPPRQAFFLVDKDHGRTVCAPIFV